MNGRHGRRVPERSREAGVFSRSRYHCENHVGRRRRCERPTRGPRFRKGPRFREGAASQAIVRADVSLRKSCGTMHGPPYRAPHHGRFFCDSRVRERELLSSCRASASPTLADAARIRTTRPNSGHSIAFVGPEVSDRDATNKSWQDVFSESGTFNSTSRQRVGMTEDTADGDAVRVASELATACLTACAPRRHTGSLNSLHYAYASTLRTSRRTC